ncbi:IclR family transcriptional regulator [Bacillaceae bacterium]
MKELHVKTVRSIERALSILNCFTFEERELSIGDFVAKTNLSRATIYRILQTMQKMNYIRYNANTDKYSLSIRLFELGSIAYDDHSLLQEVSPYLDQLFKRFRHTILLATLDEDQLIYLDKRESAEGLKVSSRIGKLRDPDYGILGKTLLSFLPEADRSRILEILEKKRTPQQMSALLEKIRLIQSLGYGHAKDETMMGVAGVAAPIFNHRGLLAAVGVLVPSAEFDQVQTDELIREVTQTCGKISQSLGYQGE